MTQWSPGTVRLERHIASSPGACVEPLNRSHRMRSHAEQSSER